MKRKSITAVLITMMALSLTACGGSAGGTNLANNESTTNSSENLSDTLADTITSLSDTMADTITDISDTMTDAVNSLPNTMTDATNNLADAVTDVANNLSDTATDASTNLPNTLTDLETAISTIIEEFNTAPTIEETVLLDESDIKITATDLTYTGYSVDLGISIENNTDKNLSFASGTVGYCCTSINNCMIKGGYLNEDVAAGKKAKETISFSRTELELYGIREIADIQVGFVVKDDDYDEYFKGTGQVRTSVADSYDYTVNTYKKAMDSKALEVFYDCTIDYYEEQELYNENGVSMVSQALITNSEGEQAFLLELVNNSSEMVNVALCNPAVNGVGLYGSTWTTDTIRPGARCIMEAEVTAMLDGTCWELLGLGEVHTFSGDIILKDDEYTEVVAPKEIQIALSTETPVPNITGTEVYNENGVRIISKGIVEDSFDLSDDLHMVFLAENQSGALVTIGDAYDTFSLNGYMSDCIMYAGVLPPGRYAVLDVQISEWNLEECGITSPEDITEAEIGFEIRNKDYKLLAEPVVSVSY